MKWNNQYMLQNDVTIVFLLYMLYLIIIYIPKTIWCNDYLLQCNDYHNYYGVMIIIVGIVQGKLSSYPR